MHLDSARDKKKKQNFFLWKSRDSLLAMSLSFSSYLSVGSFSRKVSLENASGRSWAEISRKEMKQRQGHEQMHFLISKLIEGNLNWELERRSWRPHCQAIGQSCVTGNPWGHGPRVVAEACVSDSLIPLAFTEDHIGPISSSIPFSASTVNSHLILSTG